eukprot:CAMPEP_0116849438 /NCGR_PEP_ID=MMETSP0418-20121206/15574_1 /TAXON_ID=1158023 /ORGANISM="Astrosyne radiata, Strain 13vi08-1A" /LENGTH=200 /DNA_ID=CAMNT_0004481163 /DNA_START=114 /DNA_END=717 /DNA_ORIENTATION=-
MEQVAQAAMTDHSPDNVTNYNAYGYENHRPSGQNEYGYETHAPTPKNEYGYETQAPTPRGGNEYGYETQAPTPRGGNEYGYETQAPTPRGGNEYGYESHEPRAHNPYGYGEGPAPQEQQAGEQPPGRRRYRRRSSATMYNLGVYAEQQEGNQPTKAAAAGREGIRLSVSFSKEELLFRLRDVNKGGLESTWQKCFVHVGG